MARRPLQTTVILLGVGVTGLATPGLAAVHPDSHAEERPARVPTAGAPGADSEGLDLSPAPLDTRLQRLLEDANAGRHAQVVRAFRELGRDPDDVASMPDAVRLAVGVACGRLGRRTCAEGHLEAILAGGGALANLAAWKLGRLLQRPRPEAAAAAFEAVRAGTALAGKARVELAALRLRGDDALGALDALSEAPDRLLSPTGRARRRSLSAEALSAAGLSAAATAARRDLVRRFPRSPGARRAAKRLSWHERWFHLADSGIRRKNARRIKAEILEEVRRIGDRGEPRRRRWYPWYALGVAELRRGRAEFAEARFNDVLAHADDPELITRALMGRAVSLRRRNLDLRAARSYVAAALAFPDGPLASEALHEAAFLTHLRGRDDLALRHAQALVAGPREGSHRAAGLWMLGWICYRTGRYDEAMKAWEDLLFEFPSQAGWSRGGVAGRVAYWTGRALQRAGRTKRATDLWARLVRTRPLAYYSHLAYDRLRTHAPERAQGLRGRGELGGWPTETTRATDFTLPDLPGVRPVAELIRHGLHAEAWRQLRWVYWREQLPQSALDFVAAFAREAADLHASHRVLLRRAWFTEHPEEGQIERWRMAFPVAYRDLVERHAKRQGLDPFLLLAIMRHESGFNPRAVSGARAAGLIQVILPTARMTARMMGERAPRRLEQMFEPERNIRIGARYLRHVLEQVDGNAAMATAGYNAGAGAARVWRDRWDHLDTDEVVEELPYKEAHGYTKQVMETWGAYRYLYAPKGAPEARRVPLSIRVKPAQQAEIGPISSPSASLTPPGASPTFGPIRPRGLGATP